MALVKCPDCGREVSDAAPACVGCGRPLADESWFLRQSTKIQSPQTQAPSTPSRSPFGWLLLAGTICVGSCVALRACGDRSSSRVEQAKSAPPSDPRKTCSSNADCTGNLVCIQRAGGTHCEVDPSAPPPANDSRTCLPAAKRLLDKAYACGFATVGVTEAQLCSATTYGRIIELEALNCREMLNLLAATLQ
jgi:hypothetical protein